MYVDENTYRILLDEFKGAMQPPHLPLPQYIEITCT